MNYDAYDEAKPQAQQLEEPPPNTHVGPPSLGAGPSKGKGKKGGSSSGLTPVLKSLSLTPGPTSIPPAELNAEEPKVETPDEEPKAKKQATGWASNKPGGDQVKKRRARW